MNNILAFDIETVPDLAAGKKLYDLDGLSEADVAKAMFHIRQQESGGSEFMRHHLHRIVAIAVVFKSDDEVKVWSLGNADAEEAEILQRFFDGIEYNTPTLVSWNGGGFDLPVLHYRALLHGVRASRYWEGGADDPTFRWNNYLNRYHERHIDLMDVLSAYQPRAAAPLQQIAMMLGLPGKMGFDGGKVFDAWMNGEINAIRDYCETDALNTYLIYLRFELMRGGLEAATYAEECARLRQALTALNKPHLREFLRRWEGNEMGDEKSAQKSA